MSCLYGLADRYKAHQVKKDAMCCYLKSVGRMPVGVQVPPPAPQDFRVVKGLMSLLDITKRQSFRRNDGILDGFG